MALLQDQKFSTFQDGGDLAVGDTIVGLRGGVNTKFDYDGTLPSGVIVPIVNGGTGADNAAAAMVNLGLEIGVDVQAWSASLDALSALGGNGIVVQTGANTFANRTATGTLNQIAIANGDGVSGNPTFSISSTLNLPGTFNIQSSTSVNAINNDSTLATASATTLSTDGAIKQYVDDKTADLIFLQPARVASTGNFASTYNNGTSGVGATLTASSNGAASIDGVALSLNDRVLFKNQTSTLENGIYTVTQVGDGSNPAIYTRATDFDQPSEIQAGDLVTILEGTVGEGTAWIQTAEVNTIGTDPITFTQFVVDLSNVVTIDGTQTVTGSKTFNLFSGTLNGDISGATNDIHNLGNLSVGVTASIAPVVVRIQTANPQIVLQGVTSGSSTVSGGINFQNAFSNASAGFGIANITYGTDSSNSAGYLSFQTSPVSNAPVERLRISGTGLVTISGNAIISGSLTPSQTGGIVGTTTNNNANSGSVGELVFSGINSASAVALTTATTANITSISLTAGDWDVWGHVNFNTQASTTVMVSSLSGISPVSATISGGSDRYCGFDYGSGITASLASGAGYTVPPLRLTFSSTTTLYLITNTIFNSGTCSAYGRIYARRRR